MQWKDIQDEDGYQISDTGKVRSYKNNRHGTCDDYHILKPVLNRRGYETVCLGRGRRKLVHRLVAQAYIPNPNNYPMVRHMDDNPRNNNVKNLAWGTQVDNMQDCVRHGRLVGDTRAAIESTKKPVRAIKLDDTYSEVFSSIHEAARELSLWPQHISSVLLGRLRQTCGYVFEYIDKEEYRNGVY